MLEHFVTLGVVCFIFVVSLCRLCYKVRNYYCISELGHEANRKKSTCL